MHEQSSDGRGDEKDAVLSKNKPQHFPGLEENVSTSKKAQAGGDEEEHEPAVEAALELHVSREASEASHHPSLESLLVT